MDQVNRCEGLRAVARWMPLRSPRAANPRPDPEAAGGRKDRIEQRTRPPTTGSVEQADHRRALLAGVGSARSVSSLNHPDVGIQIPPDAPLLSGFQMTRSDCCKRIDRALRFALVASMSAIFPSSAAAAHTQQPEPPRVILLIADGTGISHWSAGLLAADSAAILRFPVVGLVDTRNVEGRITDSGASATALATGVLTFNGAIGVNGDSVAVETVLERAEARGMATGLVATSSLVHATPASFASHVPDRYLYQEIAAQMAGSTIDVLLGGGRQYFDPNRRDDGRDYLTPLGRDRRWALGADDLSGDQVSGKPGLVGLFADNAMSAADEGRSPSLAEMTKAALAVLDRDPDGFFLMVEASQIDWLAHDNESFDRIAAEVLDCDEAMQVALGYVSGRTGALLVVVADHETGGLALVDQDGQWKAAYSSGGHTAELVPLFASGTGSERFGGIHSVAEIGRRLAEVVLRVQPVD
jgi:alkaline phosphatase